MKVNVYVVGADVKDLVQELYWLFTVTVFSIGPYFMPLCVRVCVCVGNGGSASHVSFPATRLYPDDKRQLAFSNDTD